MYYLCKKTFRMAVNESNGGNSGKKAFKKGHMYLVTSKKSYDGILGFRSEISEVHWMGRELIKKHFVKIKDKQILTSLQGEHE